MIPKLPLLLVTLLFTSLSLIAQNNSVLRNIDTAYLKHLIKEGKSVRFVHTNDPVNPIKFYQTSTQQKVSQTVQTNNNASLQSNFHLVKDINPQTDANPTNDDHFNDLHNVPFAILNNVLYFSADDGIHGIQLWRSDGTAAGTYIITNISPSLYSINEIISTPNKIYFVAQSASIDSAKLYTSDGTSTGTFLIKNLSINGPGVNSSYYLTAIGNTVYFFIRGSSAPQLWKTNGTVAGTVLLKDFIFLGQQPNLATKANGLFYFSIYTYNSGTELWRSNGTDTGTFMLKDITPANFDDYEGPYQLTAFNNKLYFSDNDGTGRKLWLTDGTPEGTVMANNNESVTLPDQYLISLVNIPFTVVGSNFYAAAFSPATGMELFKYNVTQGFKIIKDITSGTGSGTIYELIPFNGGIAFEYEDTLDKTYRLYTSTGSAGNTTLIKSSANYQERDYNLTAADSILYFTSYSTDAGTELWKSNNKANSAMLVKDIYAGATSSNPVDLTLLKGKLYFNAASKNSGTELWKTDGTGIKTNMVAEINNTSTASSSTYFTTALHMTNILPGASINNEVYFMAAKPETGFELYKSNGKESGTSLAKDLSKGESASFPQNSIKKMGNIYFQALGGNSGIYKIDSSGKITQIVAAVNIQSFDIADNGLIFYITNNYLTNKYELCRSNGTETDKFFLTDKVYSNTIKLVITAGNIAYFSAMDANGIELWKSDGTVAGTSMVKDINTGAGNSLPYSLYAFNDKIYFGANDGSGIALWKSNGTATGTTKLKDIRPYNQIPYSDYFCAVKNKLYLNASTLQEGSVLCETDGTLKGTIILKNAQGNNINDAAFLTNVNDNLFFFDNYNVLYKSDGTKAGTTAIKSITETNDYLLTERCVADGKFFFNTGQVLWVSDGTDAGTHLVNDAGLQNVSEIRNLVATGNTVFFNGYTYKYGGELYAGNATQVVTNNLENLKTQKLPQATFTASVLQNPIHSLLNLNINSFTNQTLHLTISNERGNIIIQQNLSVNKNLNNINLPAGNWQTGVYLIKLAGNAGDVISLTVLK